MVIGQKRSDRIPMPSYEFIPGLHELWAKSSLDDGDDLQRANTDQNLFYIENHRNRTPAIILPDLCTHIVVQRFSDKDPLVRIVGPRSKSIFVNRKNRKDTFIFRFRPLELNALVSMPMSELLDRSANLYDFLDPRERSQLDGNISRASSYESSKIIWKLLKKREERATIPKGLKKVLALMSENERSLKVQDLAIQLGWSERYLHRIVKSNLGLPPKLALNINRFGRSLQFHQRSSRSNWSEVAQLAGYYDQSHMVDSYQSFVGKSPTKLF